MNDVLPVLECVKHTASGARIARWGYDNKNTFAVSVPVGHDNRFTPPANDRGQITVFQPGRQHNVFEIDMGKTALVWHLTGKVDTGSNGDRLCSDSAPAPKDDDKDDRNSKKDEEKKVKDDRDDKKDKR